MCFMKTALSSLTELQWAVSQKHHKKSNFTNGINADSIMMTKMLPVDISPSH